MEPLQVSAVGQAQDGVAVLSVAGELDYGTERVLGDAAQRLLDQGCRRLIVDCAGLAFCDSQGLNRFLQLRLDLESRDGLLVLAAISSPLRHVLELTDALQIFVLADSVEAALRSAGPGGACVRGPAA
ncbi:STAS domain-containing protein [Streptomyces sp. RKAG337]|uniref:STAS domain-containing protein n=1 Tax=Streptomyces sp. RKAG337 TaxID=2893404 RepID=UPI0020346D20|nr:STAS domain-containing protein [Streptomyces sp. RKAG337]MCM2425121.1 STAS domain-containing protein [Streptomyces sp. RKAG337]